MYYLYSEGNLRYPLAKLLLTMKLTLFLAAACLHVSATGYSQKITLSEKEVPISIIITKIKNQTHFVFESLRETLEAIPPVTIKVRKASVEKVMAICLKGLPFVYSIHDTIIIIKPNDSGGSDPDEARKSQNLVDIKGKVTNRKNEPIPGASIIVKNGNKGVKADSNGNFTLKDMQLPVTLLISSIGYRPEERLVKQKEAGKIALQISSNRLDEVVLIGYGSVRKKNLTGDVAMISAKDIETQPVSNLLEAMQGRTPGVIVNPSNGVPGSSMTIQIRGQNTIGAGAGVSNHIISQPLIIIDGVPFLEGNIPFNLLNSLATLNVSSGAPSVANMAGLSPMSLINPNDIESIVFLKDADATSIYGSRGAKWGNADQHEEKSLGLFQTGDKYQYRDQRYSP